MKFKTGDIVEITDVHPEDGAYYQREGYIGQRRIIADLGYVEGGIRPSNLSNSKGYYEVSFIDDKYDTPYYYFYFIGIKIKKLKSLNTKKKKKNE